MHGTGKRAVAADQVEHGQTALVANDGLAVDQAGASRQLTDRHRDERKPGGEIVTGTGDQPDTGTVPASHDAKAVMLDFV